MENEQAHFEILLLDEFADRLKIGTSTVHNWKKKGILKPGKHYIQRGGVIRFFWEKNILLSINENRSNASARKEEPQWPDASLPKEKQTPVKVGINLDY